MNTSLLSKSRKVKIFSDFLNPKTLQERILESSGIYLVNPEISQFRDYLPKTFVPNPPWKTLSSEKFDNLRVSEECSIDTTVGIVKIPDDYVNIFKKIGIHEIQSPDEVPVVCNNLAYSTAINEIVKYLQNKYSSQTFFKVHGLAINPTGLETVTYDPRKGGYIGLHIDSWDKMPIHKRHLSSNRICINFGKEERFLLFINISVQDLRSLVKNGLTTEICQEDLANPNTVIKNFMLNNASQPVFKLKIKPGEAYIAPTENIVHDGTTVDKKHIDVALVIRGYFKM